MFIWGCLVLCGSLKSNFCVQYPHSSLRLLLEPPLESLGELQFGDLGDLKLIQMGVSSGTSGLHRIFFKLQMSQSMNIDMQEDNPSRRSDWIRPSSIRLETIMKMYWRTYLDQLPAVDSPSYNRQCQLEATRSNLRH